jgi:2'-5' RNA ligase
VRLFVAVDLDASVRGAVGGLIARMRSRIAETASTRIGWVSSERLHLTLHFLDHVEPRDGARLTETLGVPIDLPAFDVALGGIGTFPQGRRARVIWLGIREGADSLVALHEVTGARLRTLGLDLEKRPFTPHLTLARLREGVPARAMRSIAAMDDDVGRSRVDSVRLYESRLGSGGAVHTILATGLLRNET